MATISYDYMMRSYYSSNRMAYKSYNRDSLKTSDLIKADAKALGKISDKLRNLEYNTDHGEEIYNNVKAFVQTYNNLLDSTDKASDSREMTRAEKALKNYMKDHQEDLEDIGIKITSSGKLELKKETLATSSPSKVGKVLNKSDELTKNVMTFTTRIGRLARNISLNGNSNGKKKTATTATPPVTASLAGRNAFDFKA